MVLMMVAVVGVKVMIANSSGDEGVFILELKRFTAILLFLILTT